MGLFYVPVGLQPMQLHIFFLVEIQIIKVLCYKKKGRSLKPDTVKKFKFMIDSHSVLCGFKCLQNCIELSLQVWIFCLSNCFNLNIFNFILYSFRSVFSYVYTHKHVYSKCVYEHMFQLMCYVFVESVHGTFPLMS